MLRVHGIVGIGGGTGGGGGGGLCSTSLGLHSTVQS